MVKCGIDKGNIAVVLFRFLIDQAEDTFRAGKRHDNRVKLLRDLAERLVEASGHLQEGCNGSQCQRRDTGNGKKTSDQSSQNVVQVAKVAHNRHHDVCVFVCTGCAFTKFFV